MGSKKVSKIKKKGRIVHLIGFTLGSLFFLALAIAFTGRLAWAAVWNYFMAAGFFAIGYTGYKY